jgi:hypothetical protein
MASSVAAVGGGSGSVPASPLWAWFFFFLRVACWLASERAGGCREWESSSRRAWTWEADSFVWEGELLKPRKIGGGSGEFSCLNENLCFGRCVCFLHWFVGEFALLLAHVVNYQASSSLVFCPL